VCSDQSSTDTKYAGTSQRGQQAACICILRRQTCCAQLGNHIRRSTFESLGFLTGDPGAIHALACCLVIRSEIVLNHSGADPLVGVPVALSADHTDERCPIDISSGAADMRVDQILVEGLDL
jgi:hypothetical protein